MGIETKYYTNANEPKSLGLASAAVGQIPKVKVVDSNGVPTEWEAADMASGADGKSAYAYAVEGGYTGTETEFAEKMAQEQLTGTTHNLTPTQVYEAVSAGTPVKVQYTDSTYGLLSFTAFNVAETLNKVVSQTIAYYNGVYILAELYGNKTDNRWYFIATTLAQKADIPTALKNPNALTFTGAVTGSYDGSEPVTINIPESGAGNMKKLTFTGAVTGEYDGTTDVNVDIPIATSSTAGAIKVGNGLSISADGTLSVTTATYYTGTADPVNTLGVDGDLYLKTEG